MMYLALRRAVPMLLAVLSLGACTLTDAPQPVQSNAHQGNNAGGYVVGYAQVLSANELSINGRTFRLDGIQVPDAGSTCRMHGQTFAMDAEARRTLDRMVRGRRVTCHATGLKFRGTHHAVCDTSMGEVNLGLIQRGYATASSGGRGSGYAAEAKRAKARRAGLHSCS